MYARLLLVAVGLCFALMSGCPSCTPEIIPGEDAGPGPDPQPEMLEPDPMPDPAPDDFPIEDAELTVTPVALEVFPDELAWFRAQLVAPGFPPIDVTDQVTWAMEGAIGEAKGPGVWLSTAIGEATVTASWFTPSTQQTQTASASLTVRDPEADVVAVLIDPPSLILPAGYPGEVEAIAFYADGEAREVTSLASWSSSNDAVAVVVVNQGSARVNTGAQGEATLTAGFAGIEATSTVTVIAPTLVSLEIDPPHVAVAAGAQVQVRAIGSFLGGVVADVTAETLFTVDDETVAELSGGLLEGLMQGSTVLVAELQGQMASAPIEVAAPQPEHLSIWPAFIEAPTGTSVAISATAVLSTGAVVDVTDVAQWSIQQETLADLVTEDDQLRVRALAPGETLIEVSWGGQPASAPLHISTALLESIELLPADWVMPVGSEQRFFVVGTYTDGARINLTPDAVWTSSAPSVAVVENADPGLVTGVAPGQSMISVAVDGLAESTTVTITDAQVSALQAVPPVLNVAAGGTEQLTVVAILSDDSQRVINDEATYSSADEQVATVQGGVLAPGTVTGVGGGSTTVTVSFDAPYLSTPLTDTVQVQVSEATVESITVTPFILIMTAGRNERLLAFAEMSDGRTIDVTEQAAWTSSAPSIATVSNVAGLRGVTTGIQPGQAAVTATLDGVQGVRPVLVIDREIGALFIRPTSPYLAPGVSEQLFVIGQYEDDLLVFENLTAEAVWSSADESIAVVDNAPLGAGRLTAVSPGQVTIRAQYNDLEVFEAFTVQDVELIGISLSPPSLSLPVNAIQPWVALGEFDDGMVREISFDTDFVSLNPSIVSVISNDYGAARTPSLVLALAPGTAEVQASSGGLTVVAPVEVVDTVPTAVFVTPLNALVPYETVFRLYATAIYDDGGTGDVSFLCTWTSSDPSVFSVLDEVYGKGAGIAVTYGSADVTALCPGGFSDTVTVTVF
jgi:uncharacterized protein YjdB